MCRYLTLLQAVELFPGVYTERLLRRLVAERRIAFSKAGNRLIFREDDLIAYLEGNRCEPPTAAVPLRGVGTRRGADSIASRSLAQVGGRRAAQ